MAGRRAKITDLTDYRENDRFTVLEKDVLAYAEAVSTTPALVSEHLFQRLAANLTPGQMVELTAAIALENFSARFNRAFGIEPGI